MQAAQKSAPSLRGRSVCGESPNAAASSNAGQLERPAHMKRAGSGGAEARACTPPAARPPASTAECADGRRGEGRRRGGRAATREADARSGRVGAAGRQGWARGGAGGARENLDVRLMRELREHEALAVVIVQRAFVALRLDVVRAPGAAVAARAGVIAEHLLADFVGPRRESRARAPHAGCLSERRSSGRRGQAHGRCWESARRAVRVRSDAARAQQRRGRRLGGVVRARHSQVGSRYEGLVRGWRDGVGVKGCG